MLTEGSLTSRTVEDGLHDAQEMKMATIDEVIGSNLRELRKAESVTLAQGAVTIGWLAAESFSEAKLSRWETGQYHFAMDDLFLMSQVYGVNVLALLRPDRDILNVRITHIQVRDRLYPVERFQYDFFIDPQGVFADRADDLAQRSRQGSRSVQAAFDDVRDRLGDKAGLADLHSTLDLFRQIRAGTDPISKLAKELEERIAADEYPEDPNGDAEIGELVRRRIREKRQKREETDDDVNQEDE
jgi:transcriptional regulator with XRE-family HTH domain